MIISTVTELDHLLPPNVSSRVERLFTLIEQTERSLLIPVLGEPLYNQVQQAYQEILSGRALDAQDEPLASPDDLVPSVHPRPLTPMQQLIRLLQVPLVYLTLSNNASLLAVSLNESGLNMVSAEGYDVARKEDREAFARDCYMNAHKGMEQVLLFLERDAQSSSPAFLQWWMKASGFYLHNGLLLRTSTELSRILGFDDSREMFLKLVPTLRQVQQSRLRPELGDLLMNAFIQFVAFGPQPKPSRQEELPQQPSLMPPSQLPLHIDESEEAFFDDLRPYLPYSRDTCTTQGEVFKLRTWLKALSLLRIALGYYTEHESRQLKRGNDSLNQAMSALQRFSEFMSCNSGAFQGVIEQSPYFVSPVLPPDSSPAHTDCRRPAPSEESVFLHDPFGTFYN